MKTQQFSYVAAEEWPMEDKNQNIRISAEQEVRKKKKCTKRVKGKKKAKEINHPPIEVQTDQILPVQEEINIWNDYYQYIPIVPTDPVAVEFLYEMDWVVQ